MFFVTVVASVVLRLRKQYLPNRGGVGSRRNRKHRFSIVRTSWKMVTKHIVFANALKTWSDLRLADRVAKSNEFYSGVQMRLIWS